MFAELGVSELASILLGTPQTMEYDYVYVGLLFAFEPTLRVSQCASGCEKQEGEALNCKRFGKENYRDHCA
jgi:hypothetical protein